MNFAAKAADLYESLQSIRFICNEVAKFYSWKIRIIREIRS